MLVNSPSALVAIQITNVEFDNSSHTAMLWLVSVLANMAKGTF